MRSHRAKMIAGAAAYTFVFFFVVWVKVNVVQSGYRLRDLEAQKKKEALALADLEYKLGQATETEDVFRHARERGFKMPGEYALDKIRYPGVKWAASPK